MFLGVRVAGSVTCQTCHSPWGCRLQQTSTELPQIHGICRGLTLFPTLKVTYQEFIFTTLEKSRAFHEDLDIIVFINPNNQTEPMKGNQILENVKMVEKNNKTKT